MLVIFRLLVAVFQYLVAVGADDAVSTWETFESALAGAFQILASMVALDVRVLASASSISQLQGLSTGLAGLATGWLSWLRSRFWFRGFRGLGWLRRLRGLG